VKDIFGKKERGMSTHHKIDFLRLWRWTLEPFSLVLAIVMCLTPKMFSVGTWGIFWLDDVRAATFPVIGTLFLTSVLLWRRGHSMFGLALCVVWFFGAYPPKALKNPN
jgi:hypothetical protein